MLTTVNSGKWSPTSILHILLVTATEHITTTCLKFHECHSLELLNISPSFRVIIYIQWLAIKVNIPCYKNYYYLLDGKYTLLESSSLNALLLLYFWPEHLSLIIMINITFSKFAVSSLWMLKYLILVHIWVYLKFYFWHTMLLSVLKCLFLPSMMYRVSKGGRMTTMSTNDIQKKLQVLITCEFV